MEMKLNGKLFKRIGLAVMALGVLGGAIAIGTQFIGKNDVSAHLNYDIGGLTEYGKYEEADDTLYTKDKFACEGLKATLAFDSTINYKIFYYDILDNFISCTESLSSGFSGEAPLNGAYARIEITPLNDEDGKISWTEKIKYSNQLTVKVSKTAKKIEEKFVSIKGNCFQVVRNVEDTVFENGIKINENIDFITHNSFSTTTKTLLLVEGYNAIKFNFSTLEMTCAVDVIQFYELSDLTKYVYKTNVQNSLTLEKNVKYVLISVYCSDSEALLANNNKLVNCISLSK